MQMMRANNSKKNKSLGFTLVELIVVLVILAILAAILIPALLGWIDKARKKQDLLEAKNCLTAAQAEFSSAYATRGEKKDGQVSILSPDQVNHTEGKTQKVNGIDVNNADMYLYKSYMPNGKVGSKNDKPAPDYNDFAKRILKTAGYDKEEDYPYYLIVGTGNYVQYYDSDPHLPYTVYFAMFQKTENSKPLFFDGTSWVETYPKKALPAGSNDANYNYYLINGKKTRIQYYIISDKETSGIWYNNLPLNDQR